MGAGSGNSGQPPALPCEPEVLYAAHDASFSSLAVRDGYVYFAERRTHELSRIPTEGGAREHVADDVRPGVHMALDAEHLFLAGTDNRIRRITPDGAEDVELALSPEGVSAVLRGGEHVYWLHTTGNAGRGSFIAQVHRAGVDGKSAENLWTSAGHAFTGGLAISGGYMFVDVHTWPYPNDVANNGQILRLSDTGDVVPWVTGLLDPSVQAADEHYVYFTAVSAGHDDLWRVSVAGGAPELLHQSTYVSVGQMLIRGDRVWWAEAYGAEGVHLYLAAPGKAEATVLVTLDEGHMLGLANDERYLYFSTSHDLDGTGPSTLWRVESDCSSR